MIIHSPFYHSTPGTLSNWQRFSINGISICTSNYRRFSIELLYAVSSTPRTLHAQTFAAATDLTTRTPDAAECCSCDVCRADRRRVLHVAKCINKRRGTRHGICVSQFVVRFSRPDFLFTYRQVKLQVVWGVLLPSHVKLDVYGVLTHPRCATFRYFSSWYKNCKGGRGSGADKLR